MTGGGVLLSSTGLRVTHGFVLRCDGRPTGENLEVNWGSGHSFHLSALTQVSCLDLRGLNPGNPPAGFNAISGTGTGVLDGGGVATIYFILTDGGSAHADFASLAIQDAAGALVLDVSGSLQSGSQQAHR
jgi:hypothetical protein